MRTDLVQLAFSVTVLVLGAALEEMLPKVFGVGFPVLLSAVLFLSARSGRPLTIAFAVAAGAMEDALGPLPPVTSVSFFLVLALAVRGFAASEALMAVAYPSYQVWLSLWVSGIGSGVFGRILLAFPIGYVTVLAVHAALAWFVGKAAVDEQG